MKVFGMLEAAQLELLAADPTGTGLVPGRIWFNTTDNSPKLWTGTQVVDLDNKALSDSEYTQQLTTPAAPAAGQHILYFRDDGAPYVLDSEGNDTPLGSGSGSGAKNYIEATSSNIENTIGDWQAGAGLTLATTSVAGEVLVGASSLKISKDAVDRSGEFVHVTTTTIDPADRGRVLYGSFEFNPLTGYESGDLILEVYDVTNAALLYSGVSDNLEILSTKGKASWITHTADTTEQIEVRLKVNTVSAVAFDAIIDDIQFGPATTLPGTPTNTIERKTIGANISVDGVISQFTFTGLVVGASYEVRARMGMLLNVGASTDFVGRAIFRNGPTALYTVDLTINETADSGNDLVTIGVPFTFTATDTIMTVEGNSLSAGAQIAASSVVELERRYNLDTPGSVTLNELSTRGASFQALSPSLPPSVSDTLVDLPINSIIDDSHNAFDAVTNEYVCPIDGCVLFDVSTGFESNPTGSRTILLANSRTGTRTLSSALGSSQNVEHGTYTGFSQVKRGDRLKVRTLQTSGGSLNYSSGASHIFGIKYINDLTTLGVVRNDEFLITENVSNIALGVFPLSEWIDVDPGWFLDVTAGEWQIKGTINNAVDTVDNNATGYLVSVLSTSATAAGVAASNIVAAHKGVAFNNNLNPSSLQARFQWHLLANDKFVTSGERLKFYVRGENVSGATRHRYTLVNALSGGFASSYISARRLK